MFLPMRCEYRMIEGKFKRGVSYPSSNNNVVIRGMMACVI